MKILSIVLPALAFALLPGPSHAQVVDTPTPAAVEGTADEAAEEAVSLEEIRRFVAVFRAVKAGYVDPIDDARLMRAAIRGLLLDLDPHSAYLDERQSRALSEAASGAYAGLGLEVMQQPDRSLLVVAPIDDTPAAKAGMRAGDVITRIDGEAITADGVDAAVDAMRGPVGSRITLTVLREGAREPLEITLAREIIRTSSVKARVLEPGYAYLRISSFQNNTGLDLQRKLKDITGDGARPLRGLIMDLRNNPGGLLNAAVEAADAFLDAGVIVSTRGRIEQSRSELSAHAGDVIDGAPIAILVDGGTASASEVLAGALRDNRRAIVMGRPTFGKGSVQTVLPLDNGDSIKLTTARYYTPSGSSIQAAGIMPDVLLREHDEAWGADADYQPPTLRERDLPGHLHGDNETDGPATGAGAISPQPVARAEELDDPEIRQALNLLRGLAVFQAPQPAQAEPDSAARR